MDRSRLLVPAILALSMVSVATASAGEPVVAAAGNLQMGFGAELVPRRLPAARPAAAELTLVTEVSATDGTHPEALRSLSFATGPHLVLNLKDAPICRVSTIPDLGPDWQRCRKAIVGGGAIWFETAFPEQQPIADHSPVLVYNGGLVGGNRRLWIRFEYAAKSLALFPLEVRSDRRGPFRRQWTVSISKLAGGSGSVTRLSLHLRKGLLASCPNGRSRFQATGEFADGTSLTARSVRRCVPA